MSEIRVPAEPLLQRARDLWYRNSDRPFSGDAQLRHLFGVADRHTIYRWKANGLSVDAAVEACAALHVDPEIVWPDVDWWLVAP